MHNLKFIPFLLGLVFALFFLSVAQAHALGIQTMRFGQHGPATRVVLELDGEADFRAMAQDNPPRILLDMPALSGKPVVKRSTLPPLFRDIRLEPLGGGHSRLTFVLSSPAGIRSAFLIPASGGKAARLVLDIAPAGADAFARQVGRPYGTLVIREDVQGLPFATGGAGAKLTPLSKPRQPDVKAPEDLPLVVIDAGHGGIDPGAVNGPTREKDVTLAVARDTRAALLATGKYRVELTRDRDVFIRLPERVRIARRAGADLFVSIHADSVNGAANARGASVYTLSDQASDAQTAKLAARENQADLLAGIDLPSEDKEVATILIDLAMRETTNQSKRFAGALVRSFRDSKIRLLPSPHRHAGFMVLKAPDVPSVLVELGFLSNPEERDRLSDPAYRKTIAGAIAGGIDRWLETHKP